jgi:hypothetical protein
MFEKPLKWLQGHWWGLIVAYLLVLVSAYLVIWQLIEPLNIPESLKALSDLATSRIFIHVILSLLVGAHLTLILDIVLRRNLWLNSQAQPAAPIPENTRFALGLKRMVHLLPRELKIESWKITHTVQRDGADNLREELTLLALKEPVFFTSSDSACRKNPGPQ